jgi:hypothetical protein
MGSNSNFSASASNVRGGGLGERLHRARALRFGHSHASANFTELFDDAPKAPAFSQIRLLSQIVFLAAAKACSRRQNIPTETKTDESRRQLNARRTRCRVDEQKNTLGVESGARVRRASKRFSTGLCASRPSRRRRRDKKAQPVAGCAVPLWREIKGRPAAMASKCVAPPPFQFDLAARIS